MKSFTWNMCSTALGFLLAQLAYSAIRGWVAYSGCREMAFSAKFCLVQVVLR